MFARSLALLAALFFSAVAESASPPVHLLRGSQNHLLIPARVNGHPATFLLDTGQDVSLLQADRAPTFGAHSLGREVHSGDHWFELARVDTLRVGALNFSPVEVALFDPAQFHGPVPGKKGETADGVIGYEFLRRHRAIINCRTQELFLQEKAPWIDLDATTRALGFTRIPIAQERDGTLVVPCTLQGKTSQLALDTGAFITIFDKGEVQDFKLSENASKLTARTPTGRVRPIEIAQVADLKIGKVAIAPQKFAVMDLFAPIKPVRSFLGINQIQVYDERLVRVRRNILGLLGSELLYERSAIIDLNRMTLYLK